MRDLLAHACAKARASLNAAQAALDEADPAVQYLCRPQLVILFQAVGGLERRGAGLLRPGLLWHFRPTTTHLGDGILRTLQHRLQLI
nr:hypothetical protein [Streptomyces cyaneogriseus]